ncbi:MAG TPA: hypothetical protein PLZ16_08025, partial [Gammaproteobacteria bacterium]|nr:hypothetical protein [Gammaproteobacteria bacterium]
DNIYQRAFIKAMNRKIWLETPWPELYRDIEGVSFLRPNTTLRTQRKNITRQPGAVWRRPPALRSIRIAYAGEGIISGMRGRFGVDPAGFDLPSLPLSPVAGKYAVVRPVTERAEWVAQSRNPLPEYVLEVSRVLRASGYTVVSVADLEDGKEWAIDPLPEADITLHNGELEVMDLLALVSGAAAVVGGIGWIVPAAIAAGVPGWFICGGQGGFNAPELITDKNHMDLSKVGFAVPERFCRCKQSRHQCDKRINGHEQKFREWLSGIRL